MTDQHQTIDATDPEQGASVFGSASAMQQANLHASALVDLFVHVGAKDYMECEVEDTETGERFIVTVQRANGETPADKAERYAAEVARLTEALRSEKAMRLEDLEDVARLTDERDAALALAREAVGMLDAADTDAMWTDEAVALRAKLDALANEKGA